MVKKDLAHTPIEISKELANIVGSGPHTRTSVTEKLWKYIHDHDLLLDSQEPMAIRPDAALSSVLGTDRTVDMWKMTGLVTRHISTDEEGASAPAVRGHRVKKLEKTNLSDSSNHWLWVAKPEFYEKTDGSDAVTVGPSEGWWTCDSKTEAGDLAVLYRAKTRKDIAYLILATTDAYSIREDPFAEERGWEWACDYDVLYKFRDPVPLSALRANEEFWDWPALRMNFQGSAFKIDQRYWNKLVELALPSNQGLAKFVGLAPGFSAPQRILAERELEDSLAANLSKLRKAGWDLELWRDPTSGRSGRQFVCAAAGGRIDLLCKDRVSGQLVVVELKNVLATEQTYTQTWRYVSWVQRFLAKGKSVCGLVVARGSDSTFELMAEASERKVRFLSLHDVGFE
jgi:SWIB/MDM2 domain/EVE domain/Endonuclease NucS